MLEKETENIQKTGCYDRSLCSHDSTTIQVGYSRFDLSVEGGSENWVLLQRLLTIYFARPVNMAKDIADAHDRHEKLEQKGRRKE
jgi:hypothetical protein